MLCHWIVLPVATFLHFPFTRRWQMKQSWEFQTDLSCRQLHHAMRYHQSENVKISYQIIWTQSSPYSRRSLLPRCPWSPPTTSGKKRACPLGTLRYFYVNRCLTNFWYDFETQRYACITSCVSYLGRGIGVRYSVFSLCIVEKYIVDFVHRRAQPKNRLARSKELKS